MLFSKWLQERLNVKGASIDEDGVIGPATTAAIRDFQRRRRLPQTGVADAGTISALRSNGKAKPAASFPPMQNMPVWLVEATRVMGLHEKRDRGRLMAWLRSDGATLGDPSKLPWCGDYVSTAILKTLPNEPIPNNPYWARNWGKFGVITDARVGAIAVIYWKKGGHVAFVVAVDKARGRVKLRGGNQGNMVKDSWFKMRQIKHYRWPASAKAIRYPNVSGGASSGGGRAETR